MDKVVANVHRQVRTAVEQAGLTGKTLLVAVSGGPDSLTLLHALAELREKPGLNLHGAHLDHGLRDEASAGDAQVVAERFRALDIVFTLEKADVPAARKALRMSLEEAAREVRYAFLARLAEERGADAIALGHTADDQAETVLMHLIRGAGLAGLRGIEALSRRAVGQHEAVLFRPLLEVSRRDTSHYCGALDLQPVMDQSNLSRDITRNRVRLDLLPLLEQFNPEIRAAITRLSRTASRDLSYLEEQVDRAWDRTVRVDDSKVNVDREAFSSLHAALQGHLLRRAVAVLKPDLRDLEQYHIDTMAALLGGPAGGSLDLPGGLRFSVSYSDATVSQTADGAGRRPPLDGEYELRIPGETLLPGWRVRSSLQEADGQHSVGSLRRARASQGARGEEYPDGLAVRLDYDAVGTALSVRSRRPGDRFQPLGMDRTKKLQDFMVDARIPRELRDSIPLVVSPRGIAWVVGWRIADWAKLAATTKKALKLNFTRVD